MKKPILFIVAVLMLSTSAFGGKRCRENGKFVKCPKANDAVAAVIHSNDTVTPVNVVEVPKLPTPPAVVSPTAKAKTGVTVTSHTSSKGKQFQRCRDSATGKFVKCQ